MVGELSGPTDELVTIIHKIDKNLANTKEYCSYQMIRGVSLCSG